MNKTYDEFIRDILNNRGRFNCGSEYHERHHIVPRCLGGTDGNDNLIDLFAREHFEAHRLLALENPDNDELIYAWGCMAWVKSKNQDRVKITPEEYEELKKSYSEMCSKRYAGENNPMYGISPKERMDEKTYKTWMQKVIDFNKSEESRQNRREKNTGKKYSDEVNKKKGRSGAEHHMYGKHHSEETKQKIRKANTGRIQSEETRKKISDAIMGEKNPFYGKTHTEESKKKISEAKKGRAGWNKGIPLSDEHKAKLSAAKIGKRASDETRAKLSEARRGAKSSTARKVVQYDINGNFIRVWDYIKQASDVLSVNKSSIGACCRGEQKTAGGFVWRYFVEEDGDYDQNISV